MHQPATSRLAAWASAMLLVLGVASCSSDDGGGDDPLSTLTDPPTTTTAAPTTTSTTTTTKATSTSAAPTTAATSTTTAPVPTTSVDDLKAQIAADYVAAYESTIALLASPSADGLDERLATMAAPGSPYFDALKANVLDHVRLGEVTVPGDPPYHSVTVEAVELVSSEQVDSAVLTVCEVDNLKRILPAERSPVNEDILVYGGELNARRYRSHVVSTPNGWLQDETTAQYDETYPGATACGAAS